MLAVASLSFWSEVQVICVWSCWCHCHLIISCFIKIQIGWTFLVPAYPGWSGKDAVCREWVLCAVVQKGFGYHLDLFVLALLIIVCSLLGLPWFVAATVRSVTHVRSLIKYSDVSAPGERPEMLGVRSAPAALRDASCVRSPTGTARFNCVTTGSK